MRFLKIHRGGKKSEDRKYNKTINLGECGIQKKISDIIKDSSSRTEETRGGKNWLQEDISKCGKEVEEADGY